MAKNPEAVLELPVSFGNVNVGDKSARLGISILREHLKVPAADKNLCGRRLTGTISVAPEDEQNGQGRLPGMEGLGKLELKGVFDCKSLSVSPKMIGTGLTFAIKGLDVSTLAHFARRQGLLVVNGVEDLPEESADEDEEGEKPRKTSAPPRPREDWESTPIAEALPGLGKKVYDGIAHAGIKTIGELFDWKNNPAYADGRFWTDLSGVGKAACDKLDDAIEAFWAAQKKAIADKIGKE